MALCVSSRRNSGKSAARQFTITISFFLPLSSSISRFHGGNWVLFRVYSYTRYFAIVILIYTRLHYRHPSLLSIVLQFIFLTTEKKKCKIFMTRALPPFDIVMLPPLVLGLEWGRRIVDISLQLYQIVSVVFQHLFSFSRPRWWLSRKSLTCGMVAFQAGA